MMLVERPQRSLLARVGQSLRSYWRGPYNLKSIQDSVFSDYAPSVSGVSVSEHTAFTCSAFWDGVNQISSDVAKLPLNLMKRRKEGGSDPYTTSRTYRLLKYSPNPEMRSMVFRRTLTAHALVYGNGFAEIQRENGTGQPLALWPIHPNRVQPYYDKVYAEDGRRFPLRYKIDGKTDLLPLDILHIQGLGCDGVVGYNLVDFARQALGLALASERFASAFFGNGTRFGGILSSDQALDDEQKDAIRETINKMHQSADKAFRLLVLEGGMTFTESGVKPNDAQMTELRNQQIEEVARFLNIPPHKLKKLDRSTFSNIEQQDLEYYKGPIINWATLWEEELNAKLIPSLEQSQQFIKHNVNAFLRGDTVARTAFYSAMLDRGVFNADTVLELEDLNPQPGGQGQMFLVQGAMVPKDKLGALADSTIKKNEAKSEPPTPPQLNASDETKALREQIAAVELARDEALATAQGDRDARLALEATGQATAQELAAVRASETQALGVAERASLLADELQQQLERSDAVAREAAVSEAVKETARVAAETTAADALAALSQAHEQLEDARRAAASALAESERATADAEVARQAVADAVTKAEQSGADAVTQAEARAKAERQVQALDRLATAASAESFRLQSELEAANAREVQAAETLRAAQSAADAATQRATSEAEARAKSDATAALLEASATSASQERAAAEQRAADAEAKALEALANATASATERSDAIMKAEAARAELELAKTVAAEAERKMADALQSSEATQALLTEREAVITERDFACQQMKDQIAALETTLSQTRGDHDSTLTALRSALTLMEKDREQDRAALVALEARLADEVSDKARVAIELRDSEQAASDGIGAEIAAHRTLVVDIMRRMIDRESDRARRAQVTPEKLRHWLETFYDGHEDLCRTALLPAVRIHCAFLRSVDDPVESTRRLVAAHVDESKRQILTVLDGDADDVAASLPQLLHRWETERPTVIADKLMEKELQHARQKR